MTDRRHLRTCTLCEAMCGVVITTSGPRVTGIRGDPDDPFSKGHICPKAVALQDIHDDPDRLRLPMRRTGREWHPVSWDEALDEAATRLTAVQQAHGRDALAVYLGNPTVHSLGAMLFAPGLVRALRTRNRYSATSVDQLPHHVAAMTMFGHALLIPIPDIDHTQHLLIFGANPAASNGSLMTAPGVSDRIKAIRARGGRVVLIDPRRTETAALANAHHFIRPGTDALLLLAILHVVFADGSVRVDHHASYLNGLDDLRALVSRFPPARVSAITGITADTISTIARDFTAAPMAVAYGRVGVSMQEFGGLACWLISALNVVTGRLDVRGGAMFTRPAVDILKADQRSPDGLRFGRWTSRIRGLPEFAGELPVSALAEEIETAGPGQVRALLTHAGNPVLSTPNGQRLERAIASLEYHVAIDFYLNETTRHANLILPPTFALERDHYDLVFHTLAVRNTAKYSPAVFERPDDARHDWEILNGLTWRMTGTRAARVKAAALSLLTPRRMVDIGLRQGPYGTGFRPFGGGLRMQTLEQQPHGVDLGPLQPALPGRLRTADRRMQLAPALLLADVDRLEATLTSTHLSTSDTPRATALVDSVTDAAVRQQSNGVTDGSLSLIGRRALRSNNSWMHNSERLVRGRNRCTLLMHPDDAAARALCDGNEVRITSRVGVVVVPLEVTDSVMPGVVSLPHGWGHGRDGTRLSIANAHAGVSINDLTDDQRIDTLTGNAGFSGVPVQVAPATA
ncbi:MAG: molybdopterin-dependent oxidoreductase [Gemmatimonadaceae bacterium]|nr:molybdopterin-dependent oxidoreductase [Gemmatimonadaceae bacterium]